MGKGDASKPDSTRHVFAGPATLQEAREATDALLHDIFEEEDTGAPEAPPRSTASQPSQEEDWPAELHSMHLPEV